MEVSNIFDILKEEFRKQGLDIGVFCTDVLKISRHIFNRLKKCVSWSQAITADDDQKIVNDIQRWLNEQKEKRDLNEVFDTAIIANNVNHFLKGNKTRGQFLIEQLNIPKGKFTSLIKNQLNIKI